MIRIRYRGSNDLSPGLHATAERRGRRTTVYLLAGMTAAERRSALRRLRLTARMGHCPPLPAGQLAFALFTDRIRTGLGRAGAVLRLHPAGSTVPIMVLSGGAIAFLLFSTVSIRVIHPQAADQPDAGPPAASASAIAIGTGAPGQSAGQGGPGDQGSPGDSGGSADRASRGSGARQLTQPGSGAADTTPALAAGGGGTGAGSDGTGSGGGSGASASNGSKSSNGSGGRTLSGNADPTQPATQPAATATSGPASGPAATAPATTPPSSSGPSSSSPGGVCVGVSSLQVCLKI